MRLPIPSTLLALVALACSSVSAQTISRQLAITPTSVNFGSVSVGSSGSVSLTITNTGNKSTNIKSALVSGAGFSCNGLPMSLGPGQSSAFTISFTPTLAGTVNGSLSVSGTGSNQPATVTLSGTGAGYPQITTSPIALSFGTVNVGASSTLPVTITNAGAASATISQYGATSGFTVSGLTLPLNLAPGQSTSFNVTFTPTTAGTISGTASVISDASNSPTNVALSGSSVSAVGQLTPNPTSLSFGTVTVGTSSTLPVIVTNTGTASATLSQYGATGSGFTAGGLTLPLSLAPGQSASFNVTFTPSTSGTDSGAASVTSNAANSPTSVALSGSSTSAVGQLAVNPTTLSFGTVTLGTSSTLPVALSNTGTGSTTISQATVSGSGFSVSGLALPLTLAPGQGTSFSVAFAPTTGGSASGSLSLASDASNSPTSVSLTATGGNLHSVSLSWTETSTVAGFNIYRSTQSGGPYTRMNSSLEANTAYVDTAVSAGQTYYYVTTAVDSTGTESTYSGQVTAVIPSP